LETGRRRILFRRKIVGRALRFVLARNSVRDGHDRHLELLVRRTITEALNERNEPTGAAGKFLDSAFATFAEDLTWWATAAKAHRAVKAPPY